MIVAAHQPTFLPWLGWWDKLLRADVLVLLDDVQFPKKGGTWMNRVRMLVNGKPAWVTVPVDRRYHGFRSVREIRIDDTKPWQKKIEATIATSYGRAPHFGDVNPVLQELIRLPVGAISEFNETALRRIADRLGLDVRKLVRQSDVHAEGAGTDLLVSLCRALGATAFLTGDGAWGYLEAERFAEAGLELVEQRFAPPEYPQLVPEHVPGLSIVDALMNCGFEGTRALLARTTRG